MADLNLNSLQGTATNSCKEMYLGPTHFPKFNICITIVLAILCLIPGLSLIIISCCCDKEEDKKKRLIAGLLQFVTTVLLVGLIASFYIAYLLIKAAVDQKKEEMEEEKRKLNEKLNSDKETGGNQ